MTTSSSGVEDERLRAEIVRGHRRAPLGSSLGALLTRIRGRESPLRTLYHTRGARAAPRALPPLLRCGKIFAACAAGISRSSPSWRSSRVWPARLRRSSSPPPGPRPAGPALRLGALLPLTGPGAWFGAEIKQGLDLAGGRARSGLAAERRRRRRKRRGIRPPPQARRSRRPTPGAGRRRRRLPARPRPRRRPRRGRAERPRRPRRRSRSSRADRPRTLHARRPGGRRPASRRERRRGRDQAGCSARGSTPS